MYYEINENAPVNIEDLDFVQAFTWDELLGTQDFWDYMQMRLDYADNSI